MIGARQGGYETHRSRENTEAQDHAERIIIGKDNGTARGSDRGGLEFLGPDAGSMISLMREKAGDGMEKPVAVDGFDMVFFFHVALPFVGCRADRAP